MTPYVRFITLGCKVNQYETQAMRESLQDAGMSIWQDDQSQQDVKFVVINTCTVTANADKENLYWIRRARREHPEAKIVVTGCMVERDRDQLAGVSDIDLLVSNYHKSDIRSALTESCTSWIDHSEVLLRERKRFYAPMSISETQGGGRAFLKVQDGCNHSCSFCKVVLVRGRSRSRSIVDIVEEAKRLRDSGYRELVFAGIQLGAYGIDLGAAEGLSRVVEACSEIEGIERLRLSSIEPTDISDELIATMAGISKCCPQMHIPLQSGDDEVLQRMNRRYTGGFYRELIHKLKATWPEFMLTLDVMAGFPGESDTQFQNTLELLESIKPLKCHVFPYSRREGTRAAAFPDHAAALVRSRVKTLIDQAEKWSLQVRRPWVGRTVQVLVESQSGSGLLHGMTPHYIKVCFAGPETWIGTLQPVELLHIESDFFLGRSVHETKASLMQQHPSQGVLTS